MGNVMNPIKLNLEKLKVGRRTIFDALRIDHIGVQVHYIPVYLQPYYQQLGYKRGICPDAEDFYQSEISIPLYSMMAEKDIKYVIETIFSLFKKI